MMGRLLKIEWLKLWPYRVFRFFIIAYLGIICLFFFSPQFIEKSVFGEIFKMSVEDLLGFPRVWHVITYVTSSVFNLFLAIIMISVVSNEYSNRTIRQNIIDGLSRKEVIGSKFLLMLAIAVFATLAVTIMIFIQGYIHTSKTWVMERQFEDSAYIVAFFLSTLHMLTFAAFVGHLFRRSSLAIVIFLLYVILVEPIYREWVPAAVVDFLPSAAVFNTIYWPGGFQQAIYSHHMLISIGYILLFQGLTYLLLKKRDL